MESKAKKKTRTSKPGVAKSPAKKPVRMLAGGNPQIAKADGDAPVQAYIAALPGWKGETARWVDEVVTRSVPGVKKAVKWNSPLYGLEGQGWFAAMHAFTGYVKVTFFKGAALKPLPPGATAKSGDSRWIDLREGEERDEKQLAEWMKQAAKVPGWTP